MKITILNETATGMAALLKAELISNPRFSPPNHNFRIIGGIWSVVIGGQWVDLLSAK